MSCTGVEMSANEIVVAIVAIIVLFILSYLLDKSLNKIV